MLLKDNSSSVGLRNQSLLVQLQAEAMDATALAYSSSLLLIYAVLLYPLLISLSPSPKGDIPLAEHTKKAVITAFFVSLLPLSIFLGTTTDTVISS